MSDNLRVILVQHSRLLRQALAYTLDAEIDLEVVGHTDSTPEAEMMATELQPDIAIVDADILGEHGAGFVAHVKGLDKCRTVLLIADRVTPAQVERAMSAGADGFTLKAIEFEEFADTIRRVARGEVLLHPTIASLIVQSLSAFTRGERHPGPVLTDRQQEIVRLLAAGLPNKQIARRLDIGVETVKTHISKILAKLGVSSRTEAVLVAMREGMLGSGFDDDVPSITSRAAARRGESMLQRHAN